MSQEFPSKPSPLISKENYMRQMWKEKPEGYLPLAHTLTGVTPTFLSHQKNINNSFARKYMHHKYNQQNPKPQGNPQGGRKTHRRKTHRRKSYRRKSHRRR
jgi:hypothetical protein